jgi:APA family basic amino acid/polyamine antiporter
VIGTIVAVAAVTVDLRTAIGFSSFAVLLYYALTNAAALALPAGRRRWPRALAVAGALGCLALAFALPLASVVAGSAVVASGAAVYALRRRAS